jgi:hypothetical protein
MRHLLRHESEAGSLNKCQQAETFAARLRWEMLRILKYDVTGKLMQKINGGYKITWENNVTSEV